MTFAEQLISRVEVRRHNGQCEYGPWLRLAESDDMDVPAWVGDMIADEIAENDADDGRVEQAGSIWVWRKS
jgi:hypothetical protein